jgi:hypothetical protein
VRDLYVVALVLLAGLAGTVIQAPPGDSADRSSASTKHVPQDVDRPLTGPMVAICSPSTDGLCTKKNIRPELTKGLNIIVALVPDPERTNLPLYFDRGIEALQNAAQDHGYRFLDYWLPWQTTPIPEYDLRGDREDEKKRRLENVKYPGVLVFQAQDQLDRDLAIFLVGESNTAGFSRDEMKNAFDYEEILRADKGSAMRIIGPTFSGSLDLLTKAIETGQKGRQVSVLSGTATNKARLDRLTWELQNGRPNGAAPTTYLSRDDDTQSWLLDFLKNRLWANAPYGLLSESRTVFGESFRTKLVTGHEKSDADFRKTPTFVEFSFPPGLSYVRRAYGHGSAMKQPEVDLTSPDRQSLSLDLGAGEQGRDQPPEFNSTTPVSHDGVLGAISEALAHDRIRYSGVVATDALDSLFVTSYLRSAVPDMRLVILDADVLYALPGNDVSLQGSLLVSSYPVFVEGQGWYNTNHPERRLIFSSQYEEGIYNATRAMLADNPHPDYLEPTRLWISVIGRDGLWPVSVDQTKPSLTFGWSWPPRVWVAMVAVIAFALLAFAAAIYMAQKGGPVPEAWCADFSLDPIRGNTAGRAAYMTGMCLACSALWLSATAGQLGFFFDSPGSRWKGGLFVGLVTVGMLALAIRLTLKSAEAFHPAPGPKLAASETSKAYAGYLIIPWIVFLSYAWALWMAMAPSLRKEGYFFSLRSIELGSGISPSLPFLFICLAFLLFCATQLNRVVFADERFQRVPDLESGGIAAHLAPRLDELNRLLSSPLLEQPLNVKLACLAASLFSLAFAWVSLRSIEGWFFDVAYAVAVSAICLGLVLVVSRFWSSWKLLSRVLEQLELHPIREAFCDVPKEASWSIMWQQSPTKRNYQILARTLECLNGLMTLPEFAAVDVKRIDQLSDELLKHVSGGVREPMPTYWNLQRELCVAGLAASAALKKDYPQKAEIAKFIALRYVGLVRYVMMHLRNLASFLTFGYVLLALSLGSYPFLAPRGIAWFLSVVLVALSVPVVIVFLQMSRDPILSRMTATAEGKHDWGFFTRTVSFAALPLLSVLASHFPVVGKYVLSWVQPALKSLH